MPSPDHSPGLCLKKTFRNFISSCSKGSENFESISLSLTAPHRIGPLPLWSCETDLELPLLFLSNTVKTLSCHHTQNVLVRSGSRVWRGKNCNLQDSRVSRASQGLTFLLPKIHFKNMAAFPQNLWLYCAAFLAKTDLPIQLQLPSARESRP